MNYAWEAALAADRCKVAREDVRYVPVRNGSPYTEIAQESLNNRDIDAGRVEINPLYRFSKEFSAMFDMDLEAYGKARALFFDVFMQYLIQIDLRQSLSRQECPAVFAGGTRAGGLGKPGGQGNRLCETA